MQVQCSFLDAPLDSRRWPGADLISKAFPQQLGFSLQDVLATGSVNKKVKEMLNSDPFTSSP